MTTEIRVYKGLKTNLTKEEIAAMIAEEEKEQRKRQLVKELDKIMGKNPLFNRGSNATNSRPTGQKYKVPF